MLIDIFKNHSLRKWGTTALLLLAPFLIYIASTRVNESLQSLIIGVTETLFNLIAIFGLWLAVKQYRQESKKYQIAWLFLLLASSSTLVADLTWRFSSNPRMPDFFISAADSVYIFEYFCFFVAMGIFGVQHFKRIEWLKRAFDVSIIIIATLLAFLIFVFKPAINILDSQNNTGNFLLLLYPLADIILMFAALGVIYFKPKKVYLIPFWWILASFGVIGVTDYFFSLQMIKEVYSAGGMVNIGWWYSNLLLGLAGIIQYRFLITKENKDVILKKTTVFRKWLTSWVVYFPYILVGGVYLLFIIYHNSALNLLRELFTGLGAIFGLVLVRQVVVISENRQLLKSLSLSNQKLKLQTQDLQGEIDKSYLIQEKLSYDAMHDALTGLSNRVLFTNRLEHAFEKINRKPGLVYSVLFLDLDNFKSINDILGHNAGDLALIELGHRLGKCIRTEDTLARFGGDEFVILLENTDEKDVTLSVANRILVELQRPFLHNETKVTVTCSIGIVQSIYGYRNPEEVLRDVDIAMYTAKKTGKAKFEIFNIEMGTAATYQLEVEGELHRAITNKELFLQYQPITNLTNQKIVGFEALLRWQHPMRGLLEPDDFIPIAEDSGAINPIGDWVLRAACEQMQSWSKTSPEAEEMFLSINISGKQMLKPSLVKSIRQILDDTGLNPHQLTLEVTENTLIMDEKVVSEQITALRAMGISISVDDFGTGYSSLYNLNNFHIDEIKIDNLFAENIGPGKKNYAICSSLIHLARQLGIRTIIEGIEEADQLEVFTSLGCDMGQGYFLARPMLASDVQLNIIEEQTFQLPAG
ncbi:MAG: putative bifunctional diguanylate cyclase/phosphodiesterase [Anaerolineaceae bacterium]